MNTNMNSNTQPRQRSEKAKEGRRRRQRERRRRQHEQRKNEDEWDYDDDDDHYYEIYDDLCERNNFIVCDDKLSGIRPWQGLNDNMSKIFAEHYSETLKYTRYGLFELLDKFISVTTPNDNIHDFQIKPCDLQDGKKLYNQMKDDPRPNYEILGSKSNGYTCFGLFKSSDKNMYFIVIDCHNDNTPTHYVKIENETIFE